MDSKGDCSCDLRCHTWRLTLLKTPQLYSFCKVSPLTLVKLWIQNMLRFAPLTTTFWHREQKSSCLTSTARQCRHNLPHFVGFRSYTAIVGAPGLDPDQKAPHLLQCPCLQADLSGQLGMILMYQDATIWNDDQHHTVDLVPQNSPHFWTRRNSKERRVFWCKIREGESRLGVAHISRFILQNAWYLTNEADIKARSSQGFIHKVWFIILFMERQNESVG